MKNARIYPKCKWNIIIKNPVHYPGIVVIIRMTQEKGEEGCIEAPTAVRTFTQS